MYDEGGVRISDHSTSECGFQGCEFHQGINNSSPATSPLADHPAVTGYRAAGVDTDDLVSFIESFASLRAGRVKGIGHDQYSHARGQKFEAFTPSETIKELIEELADASNYIDFLAIKLLNFAHTMDVLQIDCE